MSVSGEPPGELSCTARKANDGAVESGGAAIFPLPLVPFERYMLIDNRRGYPMTFMIRAELEGTPDRSALDAAFTEALQRHPLLTARIVRRKLRWCWVPNDGPLPQLRWHLSDAEPAWPVGEPIDLRRGVGIRGRVHAFEGQASVVLSFHHAVCDGIGGMRFLGDLLACYGRRTGSADTMPQLLPVSGENLLFRGQFDLRLPAPVSPWVAFKGTLRETWLVISRRPQVLLNRHRPSAVMRRKRPTLTLEYLQPELYRRFCARAAERGVTANDLMLRDLFLAANEWNDTHARRGSRGWLRITMPTSLRGKRDARMPATNTLGYALVTRHSTECRHPNRLLAAIAADTQAIRTWSLGAMFVESLRRAGRVPGMFWLGSRLARRYSTLVLSNLGDPSRRFRARFPRRDGELLAGNLRVKSMFGAPPIRPGTRAALALFGYPDQLVIAMNSDPRWFSEQDAREFLAMYRIRLVQSAEPPGAGAP